MIPWVKFAIIAVILSAIALPVSAIDNSTLNETPLLLSFQGGHMFGENPVEIVSDNGEISFIGNTSSKAIALPPDPDYMIRIEPAGLSDKINSPDSTLIDAGKWAENSPFGAFICVGIVALLLIKRKRP